MNFYLAMNKPKQKPLTPLAELVSSVGLTIMTGLRREAYFGKLTRGCFFWGILPQLLLFLTFQWYSSLQQSLASAERIFKF